MIITQLLCQVLRLGSAPQVVAGAQEVVLVRLRTKEGYEGIGETTAPAEIIRAMIDAPSSHGSACGLRELLVGENPIETERLWQKMRRHTQSYGSSSLALAAMSAVDVALWDLKGKHYNEPIHRLLGGRQHDQFNSYAAVPFGQDGAETQAMARRWIKGRYSGVKFSGEPFGQIEELDIELVRAARAGVGEKSALMVDAAGAWDARTALKRARALQKKGQKIEVEARTIEEVRDAASSGADIIMLDNMSVPLVREAVGIVSGRSKLEVSGNMTLESVRAYAETGVDFISVGALTHSAPAADIHMLVEMMD